MASILELHLDISDILTQFEQFEKAQEIIEREIHGLAEATHTHILEEAQHKLHSSRQLFIDNLLPPKKLDEPIWWEIELLKKAVWVDNGIPSGFDMLPGFLRSPKAKGSGDGKYLVIPFKHNKPPSAQTPKQKILSDTIRAELKRQSKISGGKIASYGKLQKNYDGTNKLGLVGRLNLNKPADMRGPTGRPYLWGINIYQKEVMDKKGALFVQKDIMTFRTASAKQSGQLWIHPGVEGKGLLDDGLDFAAREWHNSVKPSILKELGLG